MGTVAGVQTRRPGVLIQRAVNPNKEKFIEYWKDDKNRGICRGENLSVGFLAESTPDPDDTIYDFGCGTGRGGMAIALLSGCSVVLVDIAPNCLDDDVREACKNQENLSFLEHDLFNPLPFRATYGFAVGLFDSLEEKDELPNTLRNCLNAVEKLFFTVKLTEERPFEWWVDFLRNCEVITYLSSNKDDEAIFYTSCWLDADELVKLGKINIGDELLQKNILINIKRDVEQCRPYSKQPREVVLLGGGPSLNEFTDEIIAKRKDGLALVTTNGTYNWALEHGINPSAQIVMDGREFNSKFLAPVIPDCKYLLASQCHPSLFDAVPKEQTLMWHAHIPKSLYDAMNKQYGKIWYTVLAGSTVVLRAIMLMRMLGYYKFHIYGFDSCVYGTQHHAYEQPENDNEPLVTVSVGNKTFTCTTWMTCQAQEFLAQVNIMGDEINLAVYGNGLIANIISAAYQEN